MTNRKIKASKVTKKLLTELRKECLPWQNAAIQGWLNFDACSLVGSKSKSVGFQKTKEKQSTN